jgi:hypothetical protein
MILRSRILVQEEIIERTIKRRGNHKQIMTVYTVPMKMCEAQQEAVLHSIEDLALVTNITECEFFPGIFEHTDELGRGRC